MQKMDHVILLSVMQFISDASLLNRMIGRKLKTEIIPEFRSNTLAEIKVSELKKLNLKRFSDRKAKLDDGFITRQFFPYKGSRKHPGYQPPVVAVKLIGLQVRS